jgi:hypothetical protein
MPFDPDAVLTPMPFESEPPRKQIKEISFDPSYSQLI